MSLTAVTVDGPRVLFDEHQAWALTVARQTAKQARVRSAIVDIDDTLQAGLIGLWRACRAFDPALQVPFKRYAALRIEGEIRDMFRTMDPLTRNQRDDLRDGAADERLVAWLPPLRLPDRWDTTDHDAAVEWVADGDREWVAATLTRLPAREQLAVVLYYWEDLTLAAVGEVMGVDESRVSQILSQARRRLRPLFSAWESS